MQTKKHGPAQFLHNMTGKDYNEQCFGRVQHVMVQGLWWAEDNGGAPCGWYTRYEYSVIEEHGQYEYRQRQPPWRETVGGVAQKLARVHPGPGSGKVI